jgi:hypothetical protein
MNFKLKEEDCYIVSTVIKVFIKVLLQITQNQGFDLCISKVVLICSVGRYQQSVSISQVVAGTLYLIL